MADKDTFWQIDALTAGVDVDEGGAVLTTHEVAGIGARFTAGFLDGLIIALWVAGAAFVAVYRSPDFFSGWRLALLPAAFVAAHALYGAVLEALGSGRTIGKAACGIRVITMDGHRPPLSAIVLRNLLRPLDYLPLQYLTGWTLALGDARSRRLGDRLAGTIVVHDLSLRATLGVAQVPASVYSTSEDAYLLESLVARADALSEEMREAAAMELARMFVRRYDPQDRQLMQLFNSGQYLLFLREFHRMETDAGNPAADTAPAE